MLIMNQGGKSLLSFTAVLEDCVDLPVLISNGNDEFDLTPDARIQNFKCQ